MTKIRLNTDSELSSFLGISMRGWIALLLVLTVCYMSVKGITVVEPLYSLVLLAVGFYFGQKGLGISKQNNAGEGEQQ